jgi:hypothetical protein
MLSACVELFLCCTSRRWKGHLQGWISATVEHAFLSTGSGGHMQLSYLGVSVEQWLSHTEPPLSAAVASVSKKWYSNRMNRTEQNRTEQVLQPLLPTSGHSECRTGCLWTEIIHKSTLQRRCTCKVWGCFECVQRRQPECGLFVCLFVRRRNSL